MSEPTRSVAAADLAISARALTKKGGRGPVFGPIDLDIAHNGITLITGPDGSGKTSLLLALVGRLRPSSGTLTVLGHKLPRGRNAVQHASSAVGILGLDDLDEAVTVAATLRERKAWLAPWYSIVREPRDAETAELLSLAFGDLDAPTAKTRIHELDEAQNLLLRLALALMSKPQILVVDQIDQLHELEARDAVWQRLRAISETGVTVIVSATNPREATRLGWGCDILTHISLA